MNADVLAPLPLLLTLCASLTACQLWSGGSHDDSGPSDTQACPQDTGEQEPDTGADPTPAGPFWTLEQPADSSRTWLVSPAGERTFALGVNSVMRSTTCDGMEDFIRRMEPSRAAARSWARLSTGEVNGEVVNDPYCFNSVGAFSERNDFDDEGGDSWMIRPVEDGGAGAPYTVALNPAATSDDWSLKDEAGDVLRPGYAGYRMGDPYNPEFLADLDAMVAEDVLPRAADPGLQMWFLGNEIGIWDRTDPDVQGVRDFRRHLWSDCPSGSTLDAPRCAPHALAAFLRDEYGALSTLNEAWESAYPGEDFAVIVEEGPRPVPYEHDCNYDCRYDLQRFVHDELLARWVRETTTRVRAADPSHLLSSPRLALSNQSNYRFWAPTSSDDPDTWADAPDVTVPTDSERATFCPFDLLARDGDSGFDLVSVNVYTGHEQHDEPWFSEGLEKLHERSGLPVYVSEFGIRAKIDGWSNVGGATAFVPSTDGVDDQEQRGERYASQLRQFASVPWVVGVAWHAWSDRYLAEDEDHQINIGLLQCDDDANGYEAGARWDGVDDWIAETNCEIEALLEAQDEDDPEAWGDVVLTLYTFQDNSACNSMMTATGEPLVPYLSAALPFRYLTDHGGGPFTLGETIHVAFLEGRSMPDGSEHSGWVRIDDFCGDGGDDSYCLQDGLPNVDLYVGDWAQSGMICEADELDEWGTGTFSGPGGDGAEATVVSFGPAPAGEVPEGYGGAAMGEGDCGDCAFGRTIQPPACWHYDPGDENIEYCDCDNSNGVDGECD